MFQIWDMFRSWRYTGYTPIVKKTTKRRKIQLLVPDFYYQSSTMPPRNTAWHQICLSSPNSSMESLWLPRPNDPYSQPMILRASGQCNLRQELSQVRRKHYGERTCPEARSWPQPERNSASVQSQMVTLQMMMQKHLYYRSNPNSVN